MALKGARIPGAETLCLGMLALRAISLLSQARFLACSPGLRGPQRERRSRFLHEVAAEAVSKDR